jgi:hypothetical protein
MIPSASKVLTDTTSFIMCWSLTALKMGLNCLPFSVSKNEHWLLSPKQKYARLIRGFIHYISGDSLWLLKYLSAISSSLSSSPFHSGVRAKYNHCSQRKQHTMWL